MFIIFVFWSGCDRPSGLFFCVPAVRLSILTPLFLPSSSVSLSYFILAVPIRECLGKHSCTSSPFPIAKLMVLAFFPAVQLQVHKENPVRDGRNTDALINLNTKLNLLVTYYIYFSKRLIVALFVCYAVRLGSFRSPTMTLQLHFLSCATLLQKIYPNRVNVLESCCNSFYCV